MLLAEFLVHTMDMRVEDSTSLFLERFALEILTVDVCIPHFGDFRQLQTIKAGWKFRAHIYVRGNVCWWISGLEIWCGGYLI